MITLERDGIVMRVATELQASVFLRSGYKLVEEVPAGEVKAEPAAVEAPAEQPRKRTRRKKAE